MHRTHTDNSKIIARVESPALLSATPLRGSELFFFCIGRGNKLKVCTQRDYFFSNYNCDWREQIKKKLSKVCFRLFKST